MTQTATSGQLANAQRIMIAAARFTNEHNAPAMALTEQFTLQRGAKTVTVPKVAQMTIVDLVDGQDIVDEEEIGMTTVDLTSAEVGAKVVITDKLLRQSQPSVFAMVGRQLGEAMARKKDNDVTALYTNLNGGTTIGGAGKFMTLINFMGCVTFAKANKFGTMVYAIQHPNAVAHLAKSGAVTPSINYPVPHGFSEDLLKNFYSNLKPLNGVAVFEDGNITVDSLKDAIGAIADKSALATLNSVKTKTERQRDASRRGTELVMTADYGVFELDDLKGAPITYDADALSTSA